MEVKIGPYILSQRTKYSKMRVYDLENDIDITQENKELSNKIMEDFHKQSLHAEDYFNIEANEIISLNDAFLKDELRYIFIPDGITKISDFIFRELNIVSINLPNSLKEIGYSAFWGCEDLISIDIPDSVETIEMSAFKNCPSLKNVKLSSNIKSLSMNLFYNCKSLKEIYIPDSVDLIGTAAFYDCYTLENVRLSKNLKTINEGAFSGCKNLSKIELPAVLERMESACFSYCLKLKEVIIPDSVQELHNCLFDGTISLEKINIPKNLNIFGARCFAGSELKELIFNYSLSKIDANYYGDFLTYTKINTITINKTVEFIDPAFFDKIKKQIKEINFLGTDKEFKTFSKNNRDLFKLLNCSTINVVDDNINNQINNNKTNYIDKLKKSVNAR